MRTDSRSQRGQSKAMATGWSQRPGKKLQVSGASETRRLKGRLVAEQSQQNVEKPGCLKGWRTPRKVSTAGTRQIFILSRRSYLIPIRRLSLPRPGGISGSGWREGNCHKVLDLQNFWIQSPGLFQIGNVFLHFNCTPRPSFYTLYVEQPDSAGHESGPVSANVSFFF